LASTPTHRDQTATSATRPLLPQLHWLPRRRIDTRPLLPQLHWLPHRRIDTRPLLPQLHWLPRQRIFYKTAVLVRRVNTTGVPVYFKEHLVQRVPSRQTRSAALLLLSVPRLTADFTKRSFSYTVPFGTVSTYRSHVV